ncbi:hypothetical protein B0J12DRAFT_146177 [Macrophomina phaseolina]|uniref:Uncharacterized protein n=1 Tax=Macrophomina phaseolina TaxID=35725 RepID=A0ABQ8G630_9PEZI|nr:hypothetical protein B0J12DRAFT_146177 [Macrophomina phaseolina]
MPRDGSGHSHNAVEAGHDIVHGAGQEQSSHVARADKTATPPPEEKGFGIMPHGQGSIHAPKSDAKESNKQ